MDYYKTTETQKEDPLHSVSLKFSEIMNKYNHAQEELHDMIINESKLVRVQS